MQLSLSVGFRFRHGIVKAGEVVSAIFSDLPTDGSLYGSPSADLLSLPNGLGSAAGYLCSFRGRYRKADGFGARHATRWSAIKMAVHASPPSANFSGRRQPLLLCKKQQLFIYYNNSIQNKRKHNNIMMQNTASISQSRSPNIVAFFLWMTTFFLKRTVYDL